jgi:hypothetical protein
MDLNAIHLVTGASDIPRAKKLRRLDATGPMRIIILSPFILYG